MKKIIFISIVFFLAVNNLSAQGTWTEKNALGITQPFSEIPLHRSGFFCFNDSNLVYFGHGTDVNLGQDYGDLYQYDVTTNHWLRKADPPFLKRKTAIGCVLNNHGYIAFGKNDSLGRLNDLWQYDFQLDSWTPKTPFPGAPREGEISFTINNKLYVGYGWDTNSVALHDFWEYDPSVNFWFPRAAIPDTFLLKAQSFAIGNYGYVTGGLDSLFDTHHTLWRYDAINDSWTTKADYPGEGILGGFSVLSKGYVSGGVGGDDLYEYDPLNDSWILKNNDISGNGKTVVVNNKVYSFFQDEVAEYDPVANIAVNKFIHPSLYHITWSNTFTSQNKAYIGNWIYDDSISAWLKDTSMNAFWIFTINGEGYSFRHGSHQKYNPVSDTWSPWNGMSTSIYFSINNKGYCCSSDSTFAFWEYDPSTDLWTRKTNFPGNAKNSVAAFSCMGKGYIAGGNDSDMNPISELWEYDPVFATWTRRSDLPTARVSSTSLEYNNKIFLGFGADSSTTLADSYSYDPTNDTWTVIPNPLGKRSRLVSFKLNNKIFLGLSPKMDLWEYVSFGIGIDEYNEQDFSLYPNPSSEILYVSINQNKEIKSISIFNSLGQQQRSEYQLMINDQFAEVNTANLPVGLYILEVQMEKEKVIRKFIKQ